MANILHIKTTGLTKILFSCVVALLCFSSCNFFEDEFKQDKRLAYYRYQILAIPDSVGENTDARIIAYKSLIEEASVDKGLITPRKKNKLLSEIYNTIGGEYFHGNDMDNAIASSTLAIVLNRENQYAYYNRGYMYQTISQDSLAIDDYSKAISYDETYADSYYNRGVIYEAQTDFQLAVEDYSHAIALRPNYLIDIYNNRGNVYQEMQFFDRAIDDYNNALAIDSSNAVLYCNRADAYMKKGDSARALSDYKKAIHTDSTNVVVVDKINQIKRLIKKGKAKKVDKL